MGLITNRRRILVYNIVTLCLFYLNIVLAFALIYMILEIYELGYLKENSNDVSVLHNWFSKLGTAIYFSGMTIVSGGYGDVTPIGWSRFIAMAEAIIGIVLPIAIVVNYILFHGKYVKYLRKAIAAIALKKNSP